ncbi:MAG: RHS repeat-associated core domain-containing protein, partial [Stellaceae bacterium]
MTDRGGLTGWRYDQHGDLLAARQTIGGKSLTMAMHYDAAGRLAGMTYRSGAAIALTYDAAGRVGAIKAGATALLGGVSYLPFGPAEGWTQGNGDVYTRTFDEDGRIAGIDFGGGTMALTYDRASRITGIGETGHPAKSFAYDAQGRLTGYASGKTALSYRYDADGNRIALGGSSALAYKIAATSNRLLGDTGGGTRTLSYDADGNMTADNRGVTILGYSYDASGRLVAAKTGAYTTDYTNDGLGRRATRSGYGAAGVPGDLERFVYDPSGHLLGEYDGDGKAIEETVWLADPGSGPGQALPVAALVPGKPPYDIAPDQLGSAHQIASATPATVWHWDHDPFGNGAPAGSLVYNPRSPGQYYDKETGLNYNGFRDYDPTTGRYVQSDPIGLR